MRDKEGKVDLIEREIELIGLLSEEQQSRLLEIAEKCPVGRTLISEIQIKSRLLVRGAGYKQLPMLERPETRGARRCGKTII